MVSLDDLSVFIAVVENQNFSAAARDLKISPSAVSKRINRLEHQLRAKLIVRSSRRISLSPAGSAFFEQCAGIRPIVDRATKAVQSLHSAPGGKLRVHTSAGLGIKLVTPLIPRFLNQFSNVSVDLITHTSGRVGIVQGMDVFIHQEPVPDKLLDHRVLGISHYTICATPDYLKRAGYPKTPQDLSSHNCLLYCYDNDEVVDRWTFKDKNEPFEVGVSGSLTANSSAALFEAAIKGHGIALLPVYSVVEEIKNGALIPLFSQEIAFNRTLRAYYPRSPHVPINVRLFLDFVAGHLKDLSLEGLALESK
jgi:DNA-binding transcriptional LysR family regulator